MLSLNVHSKFIKAGEGGSMSHDIGLIRKQGFFIPDVDTKCSEVISERKISMVLEKEDYGEDTEKIPI